MRSKERIQIPRHVGRPLVERRRKRVVQQCLPRVWRPQAEPQVGGVNHNVVVGHHVELGHVAAHLWRDRHWLGRVEQVERSAGRRGGLEHCLRLRRLRWWWGLLKGFRRAVVHLVVVVLRLSVVVLVALPPLRIPLVVADPAALMSLQQVKALEAPAARRAVKVWLRVWRGRVSGALPAVHGRTICSVPNEVILHDVSAATGPGEEGDELTLRVNVLPHDGNEHRSAALLGPASGVLAAPPPPPAPFGVAGECDELAMPGEAPAW